MKRLLALTVCAVMMAAFIPQAGAEGVSEGMCGENVMWKVDENGVLTISGTGDMSDTLAYDEETVKLLNLALDAEAAMYDMSKWYLLDDEDLHAMSEAANVKAGSLPWADCTVTSVVIEEGVTSIGVGAFMGCDQLKSVTIADSVTRIGLCSTVAMRRKILSAARKTMRR